MPYSVRVLIFIGSQPHLDLVAVDDGLVGVHRPHRRQGQDASAEQVEAAAVTRALDRGVVELALAEGAAVVGAHVVDRAPLAVLGQADAEGTTVHLDHPHRAGLDVADPRDRDEAADRLLERIHAAASISEPMRPASAARIRSRIVSSTICATTCSKKPRTIMRSAASASRPRVWA